MVPGTTSSRVPGTCPRWPSAGWSVRNSTWRTIASHMRNYSARHQPLLPKLPNRPRNLRDGPLSARAKVALRQVGVPPHARNMPGAIARLARRSDPGTTQPRRFLGGRFWPDLDRLQLEGFGPNLVRLPFRRSSRRLLRFRLPRCHQSTSIPSFLARRAAHTLARQMLGRMRACGEGFGTLAPKNWANAQ